jgi:hypothetical protein
MAWRAFILHILEKRCLPAHWYPLHRRMLTLRRLWEELICTVHSIGRQVGRLTPGDYALGSTDPSLIVEEPVQLFSVVEGEDPGAARESEADATFRLIDFGIEMPDTVPAGPQIWEIVHEGDRPHLPFVMPSPEPITRDQLSALFEVGANAATPAADLPNPDEFMPVTYMPVVSMGVTGWLPDKLALGFYVVACFVPTQTGDEHAMFGSACMTSSGSRGKSW